MFSIVYGRKRFLVAVCLVVLLIAVALLAVSCGEKGTSNGKTDSRDVSTGDGSTIDGHIRDMDGEMDSVDPNDFQDSNLDNSALGL